MLLFDDFFVRALVAGIGLALVAGPLGCFVIWRRMAYFGDTMAHSALLGISLSVFFGINMALGVLGVGVIIAIALLLLQRHNSLPGDAILGILSHSSLALGLVLISFLTFVRVDLTAFLFGDILSVSLQDIAIIYLGGAAVVLGLVKFWRPMLAASVSEEIAGAEGLKPERSQIILMLMMATLIAIAMKLVGVLLITALLITPAATARRLSGSPEQMAMIAALVGAVAVAGGLFGSLEWDSPSGPSIVVAALGLFALTFLLPMKRFIRSHRKLPEGTSK